MGLCAQGPLIRVEIKGQKDVLFKRVDLEAVQKIYDALEKDDIMSFRDGAKEYLKTMYEYKIPIIITAFKTETIILVYLKVDNILASRYTGKISALPIT